MAAMEVQRRLTMSPDSKLSTTTTTTKLNYQTVSTLKGMLAWQPWMCTRGWQRLRTQRPNLPRRFPLPAVAERRQAGLKKKYVKTITNQSHHIVAMLIFDTWIAEVRGDGTASLSALHSSWAPSCFRPTEIASSLRPVPVLQRNLTSSYHSLFGASWSIGPFFMFWAFSAIRITKQNTNKAPEKIAKLCHWAVLNICNVLSLLFISPVSLLTIEASTF